MLALVIVLAGDDRDRSCDPDARRPLPGACWCSSMLVIFTTGCVAVAFQSALGVLGTVMSMLIFVVLGNPSSGGPYSYELLPGSVADRRSLSADRSRGRPRPERLVLQRQRDRRARADGRPGVPQLSASHSWSFFPPAVRMASPSRATVSVRHRCRSPRQRRRLKMVKRASRRHHRGGVRRVVRGPCAATGAGGCHRRGPHQPLTSSSRCFAGGHWSAVRERPSHHRPETCCGTAATRRCPIGEVVHIDLGSREVVLETIGFGVRGVPFGSLIVAAGATQSYFRSRRVRRLWMHPA